MRSFAIGAQLRCCAALATAAFLATVGSLEGCVTSVPPHHRAPDGGRCDRAYYLADEFSAYELDELDEAVERWNAIALEKFCLIPGGAHEDDHTIYKMTSAEATGHGPNVIGWYAGADDSIGILIGLSNVTFEEVALHELGHAHGLDHTQPPSIMAAIVGSASDFTSNDMFECQRVGACASPVMSTVFGHFQSNCELR